MRGELGGKGERRGGREREEMGREGILGTERVKRGGGRGGGLRRRKEGKGGDWGTERERRVFSLFILGEGGYCVNLFILYFF